MIVNDPKPIFNGQAMLNICEMAKDTAIVTIESEWETAPKLSTGTILIDLE